MRADEIAGYTYRADNYTPAGLAVHMGLAPYMGPDGSVEAALDFLAADRGFDRQDEYTFDSSDFPKIIFADAFYDVLYDDPDATVVDADGRGGTYYAKVRDL